MKIKVYKSDETVCATLKDNQKFIDLTLPQKIYKKSRFINSYYVTEFANGSLNPIYNK